VAALGVSAGGRGGAGGFAFSDAESAVGSVGGESGAELPSGASLFSIVIVLDKGAGAS
jgi:hypothetical protein